jgi:hypothetical protein
MPVQRQKAAAPTTAPAPARRSAPAIQPSAEQFDQSEEQQQPEDTTARQAEAFDSASSSLNIPPGKYEAIIVEAKLLDMDPQKGRKVFFKYEVCDEGDVKGKSATQYYSILQPDGSAAKGLPIFKKDMEVLGFPGIKFDQLEEALAALVEEKVGVSLEAKQNGQWLNVNIKGVVENSEIIEEYRANRPPTPY